VIHYRISTGDKLASPRRGRRIPDLRVARAFPIAGTVAQDSRGTSGA
jgi:hypothetical protein